MVHLFSHQNSLDQAGSSSSTHSGFSLVETLVALAMFAVITGLVMQYTRVFFQEKNTLQAFIEKSNVASFGTRFIGISETADLGALFLHLPIPMVCRNQGIPCVQNVNDETGELSPVTNVNSADTIEFFKDSSGEMEVHFASSSAPGAGFDARYDVNRRLPGTLASVVHQASVTWPLIDKKSLEFPILSRFNSSVVFRFVASTASSKGVPGEYFLTTFKGTSLDLHRLLGSPVVIYNAYSPQQYIVRWLRESVSCAEKISLCQEHFPKIKITPQHVMLKDAEISQDHLKTFIPNLVGSHLIFSGSAHRTSGFNLFPIVRPNLMATTALSVSDLTGGFAVPQWAHFYNANSMVPQDLFVLPVRISAYLFKELKVSDGNKIYHSLIRRSFNGLNGHIDANEIALIKGSVLFSRKIGSRTLKFNIYGEAE